MSDDNEVTEETSIEETAKPEFVSKADFEGFAKGVTDTLSGFGEKFDNLAAANSPSENEEENAKEIDETPATLSDRELEMLPRRDFEARMLDKVRKEMIEPVSKELGSHKESVEEAAIGRQVLAAVDDHKDFWDWKDEMIALGGRIPNATPEELYTLARTKNPDRATELDEKYKEAGKDEENEEGKKTPKGGFGGLTPTSGHRTVPNQRMNREQAVGNAWTETMSGIDPSVFT